MTLTEMKVRDLNSIPGSLGEVNCFICKNKGYVAADNNGSVVIRECECMKRRRSLKRIRESGLMELLKSYTFEAYKTPNAWQRGAKEKALDYAKNGTGSWFVISGTPGSGKTHLCTAIVGELLKAGKEVRYMLWREEAPRLKAEVNDRETYDAQMKKLKDAEVLYIDDFFKGTVTDADVNLAFELLNDRYNNPQKMMLISGERSIEQLLSIDEAIGSRIYERSKGYCINTPNQNWRLK